MSLTVYLSGEIHTNWREQEITLPEIERAISRHNEWQTSRENKIHSHSRGSIRTNFGKVNSEQCRREQNKYTTCGEYWH